MQDARATGFGHELGSEANQPARRDQILEPHPAGAVVHHLVKATLAQREQLRRHAKEVLRDVDRESLDGLVHTAIDLTSQHLRLADGEFEALAAHELDEYRQLQLASSLHFPGVGSLGHEHP